MDCVPSAHESISQDPILVIIVVNVEVAPVLGPVIVTCVVLGRDLEPVSSICKVEIWQVVSLSTVKDWSPVPIGCPVTCEVACKELSNRSNFLVWSRNSRGS